MNPEPGGSPLRFRLTLAALVAVLVAAPVAAISVLHLDARTPFTLAQEALYDKYDLVLVDEQGNPMPRDSVAPTLSEFSLEPGATTTGVPFGRHGQVVTCTVHVPGGNPRDVTAACG